MVKLYETFRFFAFIARLWYSVNLYTELSFDYANIYAISPMIFFFDIPRIFLEHKCIFCGHTSTFYDAVNVIHDVITTANTLPYTAKFKFVGVRNNKTQ